MKPIKFEEYAGFQDRQLIAWNELKKSTNKYLLYGGAAGGGKSYFLRWAAFGLGLYYFWKYDVRDFTIGLFCEDYPTLKDRQITKIKKEFPPELGHLIESRDEGYLFQASPEYGGFKIMLRNLDDPAKYASVEFAAVFVDELTKNPLETFEDLRFRMRYPGIPIPKFVAGSNPGSVGHGWVKKLWIEPDPSNLDKEQDKFVYIPSLAKDNRFIDPSYVLQLEALPEAKRKAFLEGSWDIFAGQVFTEWGRNTHIIKPFNIPPEWNIYGAIDLGWNNPLSVGWYAQSPENRTYLINEMYGNADWFENKFGNKLTLKRLVKVINAISKKMGVHVNYWVGDPAMWNRIIREGEIKAGQDVEGESYAEIMVNAGLNLIAGDNNRANGLARYREVLAIAPDGLPFYQVFDTCYDTIRTIPSLVYSQQSTKREDVDTDGEDHCVTGDTLILTDLGWRRIDSIPYAKITGYDKIVIDLITESGNKISCTKNHKILTPTGWKEAGNLKIGEKILSLSQEQFKNSLVEDSTNVDITTAGSQRNSKAITDYIKKSGNFTTVPFQKVIPSITSTETEITIESKTSNFLEPEIISACIPLIRQTNKELQEETMQSDLPRLVTERLHLNNAVEPLSWVGNERRVDKVYDLGVEHWSHMLIANGIIVHNCYDRDRYFFMSRPSPIPNEIKKPKTLVQRYRDQIRERANDLEF